MKVCHQALRPLEVVAATLAIAPERYPFWRFTRHLLAATALHTPLARRDRAPQAGTTTASCYSQMVIRSSRLGS